MANVLAISESFVNKTYMETLASALDGIHDHIQGNQILPQSPREIGCTVRCKNYRAETDQRSGSDSCERSEQPEGKSSSDQPNRLRLHRWLHYRLPFAKCRCSIDRDSSYNGRYNRSRGLCGKDLIPWMDRESTSSALARVSI